MTREEAIEYWEGLRKTFFSRLEKEENHLGRMHLQTTIDVLDTTISALRAQQEQESKPLNGWISVKDKLPEDQVEVLVLTRSMKGMRNVDKGYWSIDHFIHRGCAQVTHWMPMPELPEREKTEE